MFAWLPSTDPGDPGSRRSPPSCPIAAGGAPIVHTDDFASADNPIDWWPRLLDQVIVPLTGRRPALYQRYDWPTESLAEWHTVEPAPIIIIEGVSSARREWSQHLSYVIWIRPHTAASATRVERDGEDALDDWERWMAEKTITTSVSDGERSDAIIDGGTGGGRSRFADHPRSAASRSAASLGGGRPIRSTVASGPS